jgi:hypothetical protein
VTQDSSSDSIGATSQAPGDDPRQAQSAAELEEQELCFAEQDLGNIAYLKDEILRRAWPAAF